MDGMLASGKRTDDGEKDHTLKIRKVGEIDVYVS